VRSGIQGLAALCIAMVLTTAAGVATAGPNDHGSRPRARGGWLQFQGSADHRGINPLERKLSVTNVSGLARSWVGKVPGDLNWASPVVGGANVYIAAGDAGLAVFPAEGCGGATCEPIWLGVTGPQAIATPALANGLVYVDSQASFTSNDGRLNVFDARGCGAPACEPLWQGIGGTESFLVSSPAVSRGVVYVGSYDGKLYAFDANGCGSSTCQPLWTAQTGGPIDSSPAVAGGLVYVGSTDGSLYAFRASGCGTPACPPEWRGSTGGSIDIASPTIVEGIALVSNGDFVVAFDAFGCGGHVCQPLWKGEAELMSNTPAVLDGIVYVDAQPLLQGGRSIGVIAAFDLSGCGAAVCQPLWSGINFATGFESSPVVANGVVYIGKGPASGFPVDSGLYAFDARGCGGAICDPIAFVQTSPEQSYLSSTPAVVNGRVYMGSTETSGQAGLYVFELPAQ
jgi:outer membrane protein assembly factor BamB